MMTVKELRSLLYHAPDNATVSLAGKDYDVLTETDNIDRVIKIDTLIDGENASSRVVIIAE